jgi:hypothetical protein
MTNPNPTVLTRWRGIVLELVYDAFRKKEPRYDYVMLWGMMRKLGQDLGLNDVIFVLRQLQDRGYVDFTEEKNKFTNETRITDVVIVPYDGVALPEGVDLRRVALQDFREGAADRLDVRHDAAARPAPPQPRDDGVDLRLGPAVARSDRIREAARERRPGSVRSRRDRIPRHRRQRRSSSPSNTTARASSRCRRIRTRSAASRATSSWTSSPSIATRRRSGAARWRSHRAAFARSDLDAERTEGKYWDISRAGRRARSELRSNSPGKKASGACTGATSITPSSRAAR